MANGRVFYGFDHDIHTLRFEGRVCFNHGPALERFLSGLTGYDGPDRIIIDLFDAEHVDSTILGVLARFAVKLRSVNGVKPVVAVNHGEIQEVLTYIGFDEIFDIKNTRETPVPNNAQLLLVEASEPSVMRRTALDAHRALMEVSKENKGLFDELIEVLEKDDANGSSLAEQTA